ncbi:MAG TPA: hypothetical protein VI548_10000 [Chitinophagaceae bacterium]|nr:hypothetical protein [Chitinophagaceae bacterium]
MKKIIFLFNHKYAGPVCLLTAIACRVVNTMFVSFAGRDKMLLVLQSKNFLEGKGLSVQKYFTDQPDIPLFDFTQLWPPGYSLLLAPFLKLFNYNIYWATTAFDILASLAFIFIVRKICLQIKFPAAATNLMTLVAGCFEYPFTGSSLPTDTISLFFILAGISLMLKVAANDNPSFRQLFFTSILLFLPCFFRYAYPPVSLSLPAVFILYGWMTKNKMLIRKGIRITGMTTILIAALFIFLKIYSGQAGYILQTEKGFFPGNLVHWYQLIPAIFIDFPFLTSQAIRITGLSFETIMKTLEVINISSIIVLLILFVRWIFKKNIFTEITLAKWLLFFGLAASAATFLSLGWLSFTYQKQQGYFYDWNYISEGRYYSLIIVLLQIGFFSWIFLSDDWKKKWWQKSIIVLCSALLFIEVTHSIYFQTKVALNFKEYKSAVYREQDYNYFNELLPLLEKEYSGHEILVAAPGDDFYTYTAAFYGLKGIFDGRNLNQRLPHVKTKSILVVMLYHHELDEYREFILKPGVKKLQQVDYSNFYILEMIP